MEILEKQKMSLLQYFNGDQMASDTWKDKYGMKNEVLPSDMHWRMAQEIARIEGIYSKHIPKEKLSLLSDFGAKNILWNGYTGMVADVIYSYFDKFKHIIPQGSIMSLLGNKTKIGSLSNCFVIPSPEDSYGGILKADERIVQIMKRRGGVGLSISTLRPSDSPVSNAAGTSTGSTSFMHRYSNSTREVAQNGRRGALMLLIDCRHPDVFKFITIKKDRTQVTGANISVMLTDKFMEAVEKDDDFICTFPIDIEANELLDKEQHPMPYNELLKIKSSYKDFWAMKIKAKELFDLIVENAWDNAEPGIAFIDRIKEYCPEGVYSNFTPVASNPCGEQWLQAYDACRLLAVNLFSFVKNPFTPEAEIDWKKAYEVFYVQQRIADDIVDLELEHINRIIEKINTDPEKEETKAVELKLWKDIYTTAESSRRTGCGFTALGDMLAALGLEYDSEEALEYVEEVMKIKMRAELDCTIDLAILRGTFEGWDNNREFGLFATTGEPAYGANDFYKMLLEEFSEQVKRMYKYGRRNVSWSTVAPTGTVSILTQTTSGLEPLFLPYYIRRKKVNANENGVRVDFVDQSGDSWQEYAVLHPKFQDWIEMNWLELIGEDVIGPTNMLQEQVLQELFTKSPWYKSCANDIDWTQRINIQAVIQKYTTNAISSTINLPKDISKQEVANIYMKAWKKGLKGVTVYRDGCRTGVLINRNSFEYRDATKRPKELDADLYIVTSKGQKYAVVVGLMDNKPYEVFAFDTKFNIDLRGIPNKLHGKVVKIKKGVYNFINGEVGHTIHNLQIIAEEGEEQTVTRLVSGMLRHGAKPEWVCEQIEKCNLEIVSFGKAITRVLRKYVATSAVSDPCPTCNSQMIREEGCIKCKNCGYSKCG